MKKFTLLLVIAILIAAASANAQTPGTKGNGQVFYSTTFNWENPADDKGWTAPAGYYFLDPLDLGTNFVWWPGNKGFVSVLTQDPPLHSSSGADGYLANFIEEFNYQTGVDAGINLDNSVGFPPFDCSAHSSVVVSFETHFMAYSVAHMWLEISVDNWVHSATYTTAFGCGHKDRPLDKAPGEPALFQANISDVAAGMSNVQMRLHWLDTKLYYWAFDDFKLSEAYNNDMRMNMVKMNWDDNDDNTTMSWIASVPKSQLTGTNGFNNFMSIADNFGEYDQESVYMDIDITKNGTSVFHKTSNPVDVSVLSVDTARIENETYSPKDYGHYMVDFDFKAKSADDFPANNERFVFFNVTDSVYSRSGNTNKLPWSLTKETYSEGLAATMNHFSGSIFPIFGDCEVNSLSVFICGGKADQYLNYRFVVFFQPPGEEGINSFELLTSEYKQLDSADFNTWVTLPITKDGESEFLKKGDLVYAGISQDNTNENHLVRRNKGLMIGTDNSVVLDDTPTVAIYEGTFRQGSGTGDYVGKRNIMVHLNLNDQGNLIDGVDTRTALASLAQNYPNPFSGSTQIDYELTKGANVTFEVMDLTGRKVLDINEGMKPAGKNQFTLSGGSLEPGVYFYTLKAGSFTQTKQMVIVE